MFAITNMSIVYVQVTKLLPFLKRGIGVHHSGLIPILKEVIEILFQEGLIKVRIKGTVNLFMFFRLSHVIRTLTGIFLYLQKFPVVLIALNVWTSSSTMNFQTQLSFIYVSDNGKRK